MSDLPSAPQRVLIVSSHSLFGEGLRSLLREREVDFEVVGLVSSLEEAARALEELDPDVVIVDYDDEVVNREAFLQQFMGGEGQLRVVLLSLKEGKEGREAVVYDRRTTGAWQIEDWLEGWTELPDSAPVFPSQEIKPRRANMRHLIIAGLIVIVATVAIGFGLANARILPEAASAQAGPIDRLFGFHFWVIAFLFSLIVVFMVYGVIVFRRRPGDTEEGQYTTGHTRLEVAWTLIPLGTVLAVSFWGAQILDETRRIDPQAMEVRVVASQWAWRFEYPDLGFASTELVLPVNQQVLLELTSQDVIHSFWVPEFRVKQDALPGGDEMVRELRVTPNQIGEYKVRCAEMCGRLHSEMIAPVSVRSQADFEAWTVEMAEAIPEDPVDRGRLWVEQFGCIACHSLDGSEGVGPTWLGVWNTEEQLQDGSTVLVDADYIHNSIRNPGEQIVAGFDNVMPADIGSELTDEQIADIVALIESLGQ